MWDHTWKAMTTTTAGREAAVGHFNIVRALHLMMELYRDDYVADSMDTELKSLRWDKTANAVTNLLHIKHVLAALMMRRTPQHTCLCSRNLNG